MIHALSATAYRSRLTFSALEISEDMRGEMWEERHIFYPQLLNHAPDHERKKCAHDRQIKLWSQCSQAKQYKQDLQAEYVYANRVEKNSFPQMSDCDYLEGAMAQDS